MATITGTSISMNFQEALEDAVRLALISKAEVLGDTVTEVQVSRIYIQRERGAAFNKLHVDIEAK